MNDRMRLVLLVLVVVAILVLVPEARALADEYLGADADGDTIWYVGGSGAGGIAGWRITKNAFGAVIGAIAIPMGYGWLAR